VLALGVGRTSFSPTIKKGLSYESTVELNYSIYLSETVQIQPLMQWIINPGGAGKIPGIWAGGMQINLSL
jgi:porin